MDLLCLEQTDRGFGQGSTESPDELRGLVHGPGVIRSEVQLSAAPVRISSSCFVAEPDRLTRASTVVAAHLVLSRGRHLRSDVKGPQRAGSELRVDEEDGVGRDGPIVGFVQIGRQSDRR